MKIFRFKRIQRKIKVVYVNETNNNNHQNNSAKKSDKKSKSNKSESVTKVSSLSQNTSTGNSSTENRFTIRSGNIVKEESKSDESTDDTISISKISISKSVLKDEDRSNDDNILNHQYKIQKVLDYIKINSDKSDNSTITETIHLSDKKPTTDNSTISNSTAEKTTEIDEYSTISNSTVNETDNQVNFIKSDNKSVKVDSISSIDENSTVTETIEIIGPKPSATETITIRDRNSLKSIDNQDGFIKQIQSKQIQTDITKDIGTLTNIRDKKYSEDSVYKSKKKMRKNDCEFTIYDIIEDTNIDIMAFLNDLYQDECYEDDMLQQFENAICDVEIPKKHCCKSITCEKTEKSKKKVSIHEDPPTPKKENEKVTEIYNPHFEEKRFDRQNFGFPCGTNISIPIYNGTGFMPLQQYQNPQLPTPNNYQPPYQSNQIQSRSNCHRIRVPNPNCAIHRLYNSSHCNNVHPRIFNCSNINRQFYRGFMGNGQVENSNIISDTLNINTNFDETILSKKLSQKKSNLYKKLNLNRKNRVGSPLNWKEIMSILE